MIVALAQQAAQDQWFGRLAPLWAILIGAAGLAGTFFGARRWRENYEASEQGRKLADRQREEAEKDAAEQRAFANERAMRVAALESIVQELGGTRVYELILQEQAHAAERHKLTMEKVGENFERIGQALDHHEERAEHRTERMIDAIDRLANGKENP